MAKQIKTKFDLGLTNRLHHLKIHPAYLPHIGVNYEVSKIKIIIVAESHYVHSAHNNKFSVEDWYTNPESIYSVLDARCKNDRNWFNTRGVVHHYQTSIKLEKGHGLFKNLETAYHNVDKEVKLFDNCVYLNYFQRPAEREGDTIIISKMDSEIALHNLIVVIEELKPDKVIFVSSKAYKDFISNSTMKQRDALPYIGSVPHPSASSWWNRKSKKYGTKEIAIATGREKFERILKPKKEQ